MKALIITLIIYMLYTLSGSAQTKIELKDIKKINLNEYCDGVAGFYFSRSYEIIRHKGQWLCYQTAQEYQPPHYVKKDSHQKDFKVQRKLIRPVTTLALTAFLRAVSVRKPGYDWKMFTISADSLLQRMDRYYRDQYKNSRSAADKLTPVKRKTLMAWYRDPAHIKAATDEVQKTNAMDAVTDCTIAIIKINSDTVKLETANMRPYMQPWQINGHDIYELNINRFFVSVMSGSQISNKDFLTGKYLYDEVMNELDIQYNDAKPKR